MKKHWLSRLELGGALTGVLMLTSAGLTAGSAAAAPRPAPKLLPARASIVSPAALAHSLRLGPVAPGTPWTFGLVLPSKNLAGLKAYALAVSSPGSPQFRHFLANALMLRDFGPGASMLHALTSYLDRQGLRTRTVGQVLDVSGRVSQIEALFSTTLTRYRKGSTTFVAPSGAISIPSALRVAEGIEGLATPTVQTLARPLPNLSARLIRVMPRSRTPKSVPAGSSASTTAGSLTVSAQILSGTRTPGMAIHYLITATLNGQPDPNATFAGLAGPLLGAPGFVDVTATNGAGQFIVDFTASQSQTTSLSLTVADPAAQVSATLPLPAFTVLGPSINTCTTFDGTLGLPKGFRLICPWNPASNAVNTAMNAGSLVGSAHPPARLAVFTAGNVVNMPAADATRFAHTFHLPPLHDTLAYVGPGTCTVSTCPASVMGGIEGELSLDLQMMETASPGARVQIYASGSLRDALNQVITRDSANVFSISYGEGELLEETTSPGAQSTWDLLAMEANIEGITISVAAGDSAAYGGALNPGGLPNFTPQPSYPANSAGVSAVGGLEAAVLPGARPAALAMWGGNLGAELPAPILLSFLAMENMMAGGGYSTLVPQPAYQAGLAPAGTGRGVPDFSLPASVVTPGYFIFIDGQPALVGGTSTAAPLFAGYMGDLASAIKGRLGNVNPAIYGLYRADPAVVMPVSFGNNGVYPVTAGYNAATGLGGLNVDQVAAGMARLDVSPRFAHSTGTH
jgi:subtilase family serine protease